MARLLILFLAAFAPVASTAFSIINDGRASLSSSSPVIASSSASSPPTSVVANRRECLARTAPSLVAALLPLLLRPNPSYASPEEDTPRITTRMGGLLENYQDSRGWTILAPSGWNKFDGEVGAYDTKWQDLVDPTDNIKLSSTPVKSTTTSVDVLGPVADVGASLAAKRNAKLIAAIERRTDGILFYAFDFALEDGTHQLLQLCVNKGKIWSLDANTKEKKYSKRKDMYYNILGSFMPKLA